MIKISYDVNDYRRQILDLLNDGDCVIELGCHTGNTSKLILEKDVQLIAVDNSPEACDEMSELDLTFINADVRLHDTLSEVFEIVRKCDVLAIDLGGGYHPDTVFKVFYIWSSTFKPKHSVIRNRGLVEFYNSVNEVKGDYSSQSGFLDSYKDSGIPPQIKEFDLWTPMPKK